MTTRLLEIMITRAGPRLARAIAAAIFNYLEAVTEKTETEIDDELLAAIVHAVESILGDLD